MAYTNDLHTKRLLYYRGFSFSVLELHGSLDWLVMSPNVHRSLSDMPFRAYYTHNSTTTGCIRTFDVSNESAIEYMYVYFLSYSCMRDAIGELSLQTRIALSPIRHFLHMGVAL